MLRVAHDQDQFARLPPGLRRRYLVRLPAQPDEVVLDVKRRVSGRFQVPAGALCLHYDGVELGDTSRLPNGGDFGDFPCFDLSMRVPPSVAPWRPVAPDQPTACGLFIAHDGLQDLRLPVELRRACIAALGVLPGGTVLDVKRRVAGRWHIPPDCQRLHYDGVELADASPLPNGGDFRDYPWFDLSLVAAPPSLREPPGDDNEGDVPTRLQRRCGLRVATDQLGLPPMLRASAAGGAVVPGIKRWVTLRPLPRDETVLGIKCRVADFSGIPIACQRLHYIDDGVVPDDMSRLRDGGYRGYPAFDLWVVDGRGLGPPGVAQRPGDGDDGAGGPPPPRRRGDGGAGDGDDADAPPPPPRPG